jgi:hypothetical protein
LTGDIRRSRKRVPTGHKKSRRGCEPEQHDPQSGIRIGMKELGHDPVEVSFPR